MTNLKVYFVGMILCSFLMICTSQLCRAQLSFKGSCALANDVVPSKVELQGEITLTPDYTSNLITLNYHLEQPSDLNLYVLNEDGRLMHVLLLADTQKGNQSIDISQFSKGVYCMKLIANDREKTFFFLNT